MSARVVAAFFLLPLAIAAERFAWYAARSVMYLRINELGGAREDYTASFAMPLVGGVAAGLLAALLLPRIVLVAAAMCTAAGWFLASQASDLQAFTLATDVAGLGSGAMKGCLYALAILVMPTPKLRTLYIVTTYLAINVVGLIAPAAGAWLLEVAGASVLFTSLGVIVALGTVPAVVVIVVDKLATHEPEPRRHHGRAVLAAMAMTACAMPFYLAFSAIHNRTFEVLRESGVAIASVGLISALPNVVTVLALAVLLALLASAGAKMTPSQIVGVGSFVAAVAAVIAFIPSAPTIVLAAIVLAVAEVASPLALSRALANHHPRVVTGVVAAWLAFTWAASAVPPTLVALGIAVPLLVAAGVLLWLHGVRFDAWLDEEAPTRRSRESWMSGR